MPARLIEHLGRLEQPGPAGVPGGGREELPDYLARIRAIVQAKTGHDFNYYRSTIGTDTPRNSRRSCRGVLSGSEFPHVSGQTAFGIGRIVGSGLIVNRDEVVGLAEQRP